MCLLIQLSVSFTGAAKDNRGGHTEPSAPMEDADSPLLEHKKLDQKSDTPKEQSSKWRYRIDWSVNLN